MTAHRIRVIVAPLSFLQFTPASHSRRRRHPWFALLQPCCHQNHSRNWSSACIPIPQHLQSPLRRIPHLPLTSQAPSPPLHPLPVPIFSHSLISWKVYISVATHSHSASSLLKNRTYSGYVLALLISVDTEDMCHIIWAFKSQAHMCILPRVQAHLTWRYKQAHHPLFKKHDHPC